MFHILSDKTLKEIRRQCYRLGLKTGYEMGLETGRNERKGIILNGMRWSKLQEQVEEIMKEQAGN